MAAVELCAMRIVANKFIFAIYYVVLCTEHTQCQISLLGSKVVELCAFQLFVSVA